MAPCCSYASELTAVLSSFPPRGHCSVTLLSEVESVSSYTGREDAFFYALVFDPAQKTLLADRGSIRLP